MTDAPINPEHVQELTDRPVVSNAWQGLFTLFHDELTRASAEALAQGTLPERLAEQIEERIAELRRQITTAGTDVQL